MNDRAPKLNRNVINEEQRSQVIQLLARWAMPFHIRVGAVVHPKTTKQVRYAHSLCDALAKHAGASLSAAKTDAKREYGVISVETSLITGERTARLVSFSDYTREQMEGFLTAMECYLSENGIEFIASEK